LRRYEAAIDTYREGLKLEPRNDALKAGLEVILTYTATFIWADITFAGRKSGIRGG
jgi:hypothetical protein